MRAPDSLRPRVGLVFGIVSLLTLLSAWPLLRHVGTSLPSDLGDSILSSWIFWWDAHAVPLSAAWWNAPMFFPMPGTFALSETMLALTPLTTPMQWLGASPVAAHNAAFLLSYPMAGISAYLLAFRLTRRWDASLIAALAFAFNPYRIAQLPHIQMQWSCWLPFALVALHRYLDTRRTSALVAFAACWMLNGLTNGYVLVYFPILVGCWMLWFVRRPRDFFAIGAAIIAGSLPLVPLLLGYAARQHAFGLARSIGEIRTFGADVTAILAVSPRAWLPALWSVRPGPEGELYPGLVIVGLTIAGVIVSVRRQRAAGAASRTSVIRRVVIGLAIMAAALAVLVMWTGGSALTLGPLSLSVHRPSRLLTVAFWLGAGAFATSPMAKRAWASQSPFAFYALAAAIMYLFALGPEPHAGATQILYKPPYAWLMYLPGFDSVRVPARFGLLMVLCLSVSAALAYVRLFAAAARPRFAMLVAAVLLEGWIIMPVVRLPAPLAVPARITAAGASVIEVPVERTFEANTIALYNEFHHGRPLINGFSGYLPGHYYALYMAIDTLDPTGFDAIRSSGPVGVFVDATRDQPRPDDPDSNPAGSQLTLISRVPGAELVEKNERGSWFLIPGRLPPADPVSTGRELKVSRVSVTSTPNEAAALTDGDPATRWYGAIHGESATDVITLSFDAPVQPDVIEIDQSHWAASYARDFEIVFGTPAGNVTVFRGSLAAPAILGALKSKDVPIRIPIANAPATQTIQLICHPPPKKFTWSVGEIKVFGK